MKNNNELKTEITVSSSRYVVSLSLRIRSRSCLISFNCCSRVSLAVFRWVSASVTRRFKSFISVFSKFRCNPDPVGPFLLLSFSLVLLCPVLRQWFLMYLAIVVFWTSSSCCFNSLIFCSASSFFLFSWSEGQFLSDASHHHVILQLILWGVSPRLYLCQPFLLVVLLHLDLWSSVLWVFFLLHEAL